MTTAKAALVAKCPTPPAWPRVHSRQIAEGRALARRLLGTRAPMMERETLYYVMPVDNFWLVRRIGARPAMYPNRDDAVAAALNLAATHGRARVRVIEQSERTAV